MKNTKILTLCAVMVIFFACLKAQSHDWLWVTGNNPGVSHGNAIARDNLDNIYITGDFQGTAYFGSSTITSVGSWDVFVAKLDKDGNWLWASRAGGTDVEWSNGIAVDNSGNVYITGAFYATAVFGTTSLTSAGDLDTFIAKLDTNGNWVWAKRSGGISSDEGFSLCVDDDGNVYYTGNFRGTASFGTTNLISSGSTDVFTAKLDSAGNWLWASQAGGSSGEEGHGIAADSSGKIYLTGNFWGTSQFGSTTLVASGPYANSFVAKMDSDGNWLWAKRAAMYNGTGNAIAVGSNGNLLVTGWFYGTAEFGATSLTSSGLEDIYIAGMDSNSNWLWAQRAGGGGYDSGNGIAVDMEGNAMITGNFNGTASFGSQTLYSSGSSDLFFAKLDAGGNWIQAIKAGGTSTDEGMGIVLDNSGKAYLTGEYRNTAYFGPYSLTSSDPGARAFVAKLSVREISLLSAPAMDFGSLTIGGQSEWQAVALSNEGTPNITISEIYFDGDPQHYELAENPGSLVLAPGDSTTLMVRFNPQEAGIHNDILHIINNSGNQPDLQIALSGVAQFPLWSGNMVVSQNVVVPHGIILQVEPGTQVQFAPGTGIDVHGSLQAPGTQDGWITFTAQNEALGWDGLAFLGENTLADSSYLAYCQISHGLAGPGDLPEGGLVHVDGYDALTLVNCVLNEGTADQGGALALLNSSAEIYNCVLHHNNAASGGGAVYLNNSNSLLAHLTIADNASTAGPGAILAENSGSARIFGCNIWDNGESPLSGDILVMYSNVQGGWPGSTNIASDPRFDPNYPGHYALSSTSSCLNRGIPDPASYPLLPDFDIIGNPRVHAHTQSAYNRPDIGACEFAGILDPTDFSATDGNNDYPGHVYLSWSYSSAYLPNDGFQIYRDGSLLVTLYPHITSYADYSAIPGQQHAYTVLAYAGGETSNPISDTGYIKPNGIITGKVETPNNNPVAGVLISLDPSEGHCLEFGPGSYFQVEVPNADLSAAFTLEAWFKTASADIALLSKLDEAETDLKELRIDASGRLLYTDGVSTLAQSGDSPAVNDNAWHHVALAYDASQGRGYLYLDGISVADASVIFSDTPGGMLYVQDDAFTGFIDDIRLWNLARTEAQIQSWRNLIPAWNSPGLIGYWAMNEGLGSQVFDATNNAHIASTNAAWSSAGPGVLLGAVTGNWGEYVISQIPYGNYTTFTVTPSKPGHMFQPEQRLVTLSQSNISANNVDFTDNSLIPISGHVIFYDTVCPVVGATIYLNGSQAVPLVLTNTEGYYVLEVEHGTACLVSVEYKGHTFDRTWDLGEVTYPRTDIDFQDVFTTGLFVQVVGGSDDWPLGDFDVALNSVDGLYTRVVTGQDWFTGMVLVSTIPPLDFNVTVNPAGDDPFNLAVDDQFQSLKTKHLDLRDADADPDTLRYEWRAPLQAEVIWPDGLELKYFADDSEQLYGFYVLDQNVWVELELRAFEDYSLPAFPGRKTFLTACDILVSDDVGAIGSTEANFSGEQSYTYRFAPYLPNILDGGARPYQNLLEVTIHDTALERFATHADWVITQGARPTESTYATTSPEIPFLILHDPPGDSSYSSFRESSSSSVAWGVSVSSAYEQGNQVSVHLGPTISVSAGPSFFSVQSTTDYIFDLDFGYSCQTVQTNASEVSYTFTTSEEYRTSDQDLLIGRESDLYVGGALNLIWGLTRELLWDDDTQEVTLRNNVMVVPDGFDTVYMYTEAQILNNVIPNLIAIGDTSSAAMWQSYVDMNASNIANALPNPNHPANVSFNAGAGYLFEETSSVSSSQTIVFEQTVSESFGTEIGLVINGMGGSLGFTFETALTLGSSQTGSYATETAVSFELADDDEVSHLNFQPDYFTVDIKKDPVYGTPVFDLLAGASSNRWERNTLPRDGVSFSANTYTASGLQDGETAAFLLQLGNTSQTGEHRRYFLTLLHATNPGGATILINGLPVVDRMAFDVPPGQQVQAVMTVAQGPAAYEYEGLTLEFFAEGDRGHEGPEGHAFWVTRGFNVYWEPPYSRVSIARPEDGWIVNQASNNSLEMMLTGYDLSKPDFNSLLLEYKRPAAIDWLPALEIPRDSLLAHPNYIIVAWDVSSLSDGPWQIRAGTTDNIQSNYYTASLNGTLDRTSPAVWGLPQPSDGILGLGDLISVTFTEPIDPNSVLPGSVSLIITRTGLPVDINVQASGNAVSIVPLIANYWLENETLEATVQGLTDLHGNPLAAPVSWEFFVNANPVYWTQPKIELIKALGEPLSVSAQLHNSGGQYSSFSIAGLPQWLTAVPGSGNLLPLETQSITFNISEQLGYGVFRDTVYADIPALGREPLAFEISVLADPPAWASVPLGNFDHSLSITGQLFLEGEISADPNDVIGAFVLDPASQTLVCRGFASLISVPWLPGSYQFYLTVHSDLDSGEELFFRVWDSSQNKEHWGIQEQFFFSSGAVYGTPLDPVLIHVNPELYSSKPCSAGWNWLSVNLESPSMDLDDVLASLQPSANDLIKSQTAYAQYVPGLGWVGDLQSVSTTQGLKLKLAQPDELSVIGLLEDPAATPINYASGWNWIGYLPHVSISVNEALANLANSATGDLIKGQNGYAQYIAGYGWYGSLLFLEPGAGYMLKTSSSGSFTYPDYEIPRGDQIDIYARELQRLRDPSGWQVDPAAYEFTSNITCVVLQNGLPLDTSNALLGAFYGDACRGIAAPVWVVDKWVFFLTQYSNVQNQTLSYKVWLADTNEIFTAAEALPFVNNQVLGDPLAPFEFHIGPADLGTPQNILLQIVAGSLILSWDEVSGAGLYKVFASDIPDADFADITSSGSFTTGSGRVSWTCSQPVQNRRFYLVRSATSSIRK
ncbi:MAG: Ig-like domain-containing protein [Candidatus Syntrophosphaera sp.]|nr:Ig-like domain-containing protein [Candidatus Syntrophosphaera sp.]